MTGHKIASTSSRCFDIGCCRCDRLAGLLADVRVRHPTYHARPVPAFGDPRARLLIVGLAPGMHGANRTGRPFTGDFAGVLLYQTLFTHGLCNQPLATAIDDGLKLMGCCITNAVKCLPPANKPTGPEVRQCNDFLGAEIARLPPAAAILALGGVAHRAVLQALELKQANLPFSHGGEHRLADGRWLVDSYHCSRYNTQTLRLTEKMFSDVVGRAKILAGL